MVTNDTDFRVDNIKLRKEDDFEWTVQEGYKLFSSLVKQLMSNIGFEIRRRLLKPYVWSTALYESEN